MIFESLTITDFRVFQGRHSFDLNPRYKWKQRQPIILFGGLNGAGKTSILTAVRVALYGRQALGYGTSQKSYEEFLANNIHRSRNTIIQTKSACIELAFNYAHMGIQSHYRIIRNWTQSGKKIIESLSIFQDEKKIDNLSYDQCQGFLNELVPIGVSELFFFDGEKISELAEDTSGASLSDAIKKLLGLDLIEQLNADLSIMLRNQDKATSIDAKKTEIVTLEKQLLDMEIMAKNETAAYSETRINWTEASAVADKLSSSLNESGGAWASSREHELTKSSVLSTKKTILENNIRELLAGSFPFSFGKEIINKALSQLDNEKELKSHNQSIEILSKFNKSILRKVSKETNKKTFEIVTGLINHEMEQLKSKAPEASLIHDISDTQYSGIYQILNETLTSDKKEITNLVSELSLINEELDNLGKNIARAPDESSLASKFAEIKKYQGKVNQLQVKMEIHRENAKQYLRQAIDITKKLGKAHQAINENSDNTQTYRYISSAKAFLTDFNQKASKQKIQDLEQEFIKTFKRLARKDDISIRASINPKDYKVTLVNDTNEIISKDELSAGEKQIYAISILEALARTSGRKLPIIIDTPLGRLDSKHRTNLINNYFPYASQQVIILSTDTEVDEEFYQSLYKHISHAFQLDYDSESGSTFAKEGYFWRKSEAA